MPVSIESGEIMRMVTSSGFAWGCALGAVPLFILAARDRFAMGFIAFVICAPLTFYLGLIFSIPFAAFMVAIGGRRREREAPAHSSVRRRLTR
jgi:hypothetical protein